MPPSAAMAGSAAAAGRRSSPTTSSRLISKPTTKKKTTIRASLIQASNGLSRVSRPPRSRRMWVSSSSWYECRQGELAQMRATMAAVSISTPPAASMRM